MRTGIRLSTLFWLVPGLVISVAKAQDIEPDLGSDLIPKRMEGRQNQVEDAVTSKKTAEPIVDVAKKEDVAVETREDPPQNSEDQDSFKRRFAGKETPEFPVTVYESIQPIESSASDFVAVPDRWRMFYAGKWYDPYNQNTLKADIPVFGKPDDLWFTELSVVSDSLVEARRLPVPVGFASTNQPNNNDTFGDGDQFMFVQNILFSLALINGNTSFKPPDVEIRIAPVFNFNHVEADEDGILRADQEEGHIRNDNHIGFQELFVDKHITNISERYDFISARVGIQQFISDFRGFIYNDNEPGVRLFGDYDNNKWQFNLAWFSRLDKETNSGVNTMFDDRHEDVWIANIFKQDAIALGHTLSFSVLYREDTAGDRPFHYDNNGFLVRPTSIGDERPKNIYSTYFGLTGDGHIERVNTTTALYYVAGSESHNNIAQREVDISAGMFAQEFSYDVDWTRFRASFFWASGDDDPFDGKAHGFDAIFDNPNFAGGDLSFWQRQGIPLIGGGATNLTNRNSLLPDFRPGKEEGQSNFVNPGLRLYNVGVDFDLLPELKLITNASYIQFDRTDTLRVVRQDGSFDRNLGWDLSAGLLYRPFLNNNIQFRAGVACLLPEEGKKNLFGNDVLYDMFTNFILLY